MLHLIKTRPSTNINLEQCTQCARKISYIGLWDSFLLAVFKGVVGMLTHSRALMASSLYSIHDVISAIAVIIGLKVGAKPGDEEHPYGYGNIEFVVSVFTSLLILSGTIFILYDSVKIVFLGEHSPPHWGAFVAAIIAGFTNEILHRYNMCAAKHMNSPALLAHAQHHRADALSSLAVIIAIIGGKFGFYFLDAFVAIFEGLHLLHISTEILFHGSLGLMDRSLDSKIVNIIRKTVSAIPQVKKVKDIRTRQVGRNFLVDIDISIPEETSVIEAERISSKIKKFLTKKIRYLESVNVIYVK